MYTMGMVRKRRNPSLEPNWPKRKNVLTRVTFGRTEASIPPMKTSRRDLHDGHGFSNFLFCLAPRVSGQTCAQIPILEDPPQAATASQLLFLRRHVHLRCFVTDSHALHHQSRPNVLGLGASSCSGFRPWPVRPWPWPEP